MKTNITADQFNELTEEEKNKLQDWWKPEEGDWYYIKTKIKNPDGTYQTYEDLDVIHEYCAGDYSGGVNILKTTEINKDGSILTLKQAYPLLSVTDLIELLGNPLIIKWNSDLHGSRVDVTFVSKVPKKLTLAAINESLRLESAEDLCDALWRAYLVRLRS